MAQVRLRKVASGGPQRDERLMAEIEPFAARLGSPSGSAPSDPTHGAALERCRWMLEEFRVSLFAQELGTAVPVSAKRPEAQWAAAGR